MIKVTLNNEILKYITEIDKNRYKLSTVKFTGTVVNKLRKNWKKKSSYASTKSKEKELLLFLIKSYKREFTPIEVSKEFGVTNKTIINRLSTLVKNGFVVPNMVKERVRSYELSNFTRENEG